ncbi:bifunctional phosphoribosyl-AMP cyclohydrolase/phosphoribosyl-ATP diphosphatase HisIE [Synechococcus sp. R55.6]|uniref:bifunctional phosphoribosyl-AMP cyclohydrolase/phosphoribosyl-ATP diphosphatase HisIE n=1 Tax=unclassified Synechococcus TaxID=2626047 RepID=UPI0039C07DD8
MVAALAFNPSSDPPRSLLPEEITWLGSLSYNEQGLIPAIVQDYLDGTVLMVAWMNRESLQKTLETGRTWFWSRSRQALWPKGETSGHVQWVKQIRYDCDGDALVILVEQVGDAACHTGARSCFFRPLPGDQRDPIPAADTLSQVFAVVKARQADPRPDSYTSSLLAKGENAILKKLGEETAEVVMAAKDQDRAALAREVADLWYHCLVALAHYQVDIKDVYRQLQARRSAK